jgi:hypothetical protein
MVQVHELAAGAVTADRRTSARSAWVFSLPLVAGMYAYLFSIHEGKKALLDGDTYWHIATGNWIFQNGAIPTHDPFSHTMRGAPWTAHEWLSDVLLALAHQAGGWAAVVALMAAAFAITIALLTRALLKWLEPIHALGFATIAIMMTASHLLARPHMLALPVLVLWTFELVRASEANRAPRLWMLPLMMLWANLHGGFTLGIALALAFALEALLAARMEQRLASTAKAWGLFLALTVAAALVTPHGTAGIWFTWQILFEVSDALDRIGEWRSPDFHLLQPLEVWLLGGLAFVLHQGVKLPPVRLLLVLALIHLALKHIRNVELLGLLVPLFLASPLASHWRQKGGGTRQLEIADRFFAKLARPAGRGSVLVTLLLLAGVSLWTARARPLELPEGVAPVLALKAVEQARITGPVLNSYSSGGYLIYAGIAPFIDGRADMYRELFKQYVDAMESRTPDSLHKLLDKYQIAWTLLEPESSAVASLDRLPQWSRLYADKRYVVHVKAGTGARSQPAQPTMVSN